MRNAELACRPQLNTMKLGEALQRRSDNQKRMLELQHRVVRCAVVQEGEEPPEDPGHLLAELDRFHAETLSLVQRINRTNAVTRFSDKATLSDAIAEREALKQLRMRVWAAADASTDDQRRYSRSEIRAIRTMDAAALRKRSDQLARDARDLDIRIQAMNWEVDVAG
jgi:hypothetical protein